MIVRFEMPVNVWCEGCHEHIARGVRYNAEKKKCGTYFSSDVFEFQMNCHLCGQRFIIKTDPQNRDYEFVSGLRRKVETFDVKDIGTREFDEKEQALMRTDAIRSLENKEEDALNFQKAVPALDGIKSIQDRLYQDEDSLNRTVRDKLRGMRKAEERRENRAKAAGLGIHLLPTSKSDIKASRSVLFHKKTKAEVDAKLREINAKTGSIFGESDPLRDHTIRQCIRNGVDLRLLKNETKKEESASGPTITIKPKKQVKNTLGLIPSSYGEADASAVLFRVCNKQSMENRDGAKQVSQCC